jgi:FkbM family methyltransferase
MDHNEVLKNARELSPSKQLRVLEEWPGVEWKTAEGPKIIARSKKELRRFIRGSGEVEMLEWIRGFEVGDVFYDIGANVGSLTLATAAIHGDGVRIVAIEPSFSSFESLVRNLSLNDLLSSTIPLQIGLLDHTGLEPMNYASTEAGTSLHAVGEAVDHEGREFTPVEVQMVPTYRLDDLIETFSLPAPTRIKIDVDGYEEFVLEGAVRTLELGTVRDLVVEIVDHDRAGTRMGVVTDFLGRCGYGVVQTFEHAAGGYVADYLFRRGDAS